MAKVFRSSLFWHDSFDRRLVALGSVCILTLGLVACGGDSTPTDPNPDEPGSVEGTVTFVGAWPDEGIVRVSVYASVDPNGIPSTKAVASSAAIAATSTYAYKIPGLQPSQYAVVVEWVDLNDFYPARLMGAYWTHGDSLSISPDGHPRDPGPAPVIVTSGATTRGRHILADCGLGGAAPGRVYSWAGTGQAGYGATGQSLTNTRLYWPQDVTVTPDGAAYVLDWNNHRVIALRNGKFELVVGVTAGDFGDPCDGIPGCQDVPATNAKLNHPTSVALDPNTGELILAAWHNSEIFRLDLSTGLMDLICGDGTRGYNGDDRTAISAFVDLPVSVAFDSQGWLCFADQANMCVRQIDAQGIVHTIAGTAPVWNAAQARWDRQPGFEGDGGLATDAKLFFEAGQVADPSGRICFGPGGIMYIADSQNHCIRVVDSNGIINRFAGTGPTGAGYGGDGGSALLAMLNEPRDIAVDAAGNVYIADTGNHVIRMVDLAGNISTVVGKFHGSGPGIPPITPAQVQSENGIVATNATLTMPYGIEIDLKGRLLISDTGNHVIRIYYPQ